MALFESYERREPQILAALKQYGISSIEECKEITEAAGLDVYHLMKVSSLSASRMLSGLTQ